MNNIPQAAFGFSGFSIPEFALTAPSVKDGSISVSFDPQGAYYEKAGKFVITLNYKAYTSAAPITDIEQAERFITAKMVAEFQFQGNPLLKDIPGYFYKNGIAIVYPYLRAFITNITAQAGIKPLIMPILNLSEIEKELRENTSIVLRPKPKKVDTKKAIK